jgi:hypothetical protein
MLPGTAGTVLGIKQRSDDATIHLTIRRYVARLLDGVVTQRPSKQIYSKRILKNSRILVVSWGGVRLSPPGTSAYCTSPR